LATTAHEILLLKNLQQYENIIDLGSKLVFSEFRINSVYWYLKHQYSHFKPQYINSRNFPSCGIITTYDLGCTL